MLNHYVRCLFIAGLAAAALCTPVQAQQTEPPNDPELVLGKPLERELKGGAVDTFPIALSADQFVRVIVDQKGIDVVVTLIAPDSTNLLEIDSPNGDSGPEALTTIIGTAGIFRIEVRSLDPTAAPGRYVLTLVEQRTATEKDRAIARGHAIFDEGEALMKQGTAESLNAAIEKFRTAAALFHQWNDTAAEANMWGYIGLVHSNLGNKVEALDSYQKALPLVRANGDQISEAALLNNIAVAYMGLGDQASALKYFLEILPLVRRLGEQDGEATTLNNLGSIENNRGNHQQAIAYFQAALPLRRATHNRAGEAMTLNNLGQALIDTGDLKAALSHLNDALALRRAVGDFAGEGTTLNNLGAVHQKLNEFEAAAQFFSASLPLVRLAGSSDKEARALMNLMLLWSVRSNPRFAVFWGKQSINSYQRLRANVRGLNKELQQSYLRSIESAYRGLADRLLAQQRLAEAQQILNSFKDQQFFDANPKNFVPVDLTPRETPVAELLNAKADRIGSIIKGRVALRASLEDRAPTAEEAAQFQQFDTDLKQAQTEYAESLTSAAQQFSAPAQATDTVATTADLASLQTALRETSATTHQPAVAVYTLVGTDDYRALVVTENDIFSVSSHIPGTALNEKALQLWSLLRTPDYDPRPLSQEIYRVLFAPFETRLPAGTKTILWSLDGNLRYLPMAALFDGKRYLVERFQNVVFTRSDRERMTRAVTARRSGSGFGSSEAREVVLDGATLNAGALPFVRVELDRIFGQRPTGGILSGDFLLDAKFTKAAMLRRLSEHRPLVHIASHFRFVPGDEARSFLLLGDGAPFTLDEMKQQQELFAGVDLLTLSACSTAAQRPDANGREVDGFAELAQRLGAGAVLASLWEVSDDSTAELMTRFYGGYRGGTDKANALRRAQLAVLKGEYRKRPATGNRLLVQQNAEGVKLDPALLIPYRSDPAAPFAHQYYWSPFVLIGNWK